MQKMDNYSISVQGMTFRWGMFDTKQDTDLIQTRIRASCPVGKGGLLTKWALEQALPRDTGFDELKRPSKLNKWRLLNTGSKGRLKHDWHIFITRRRRHFGAFSHKQQSRRELNYSDAVMSPDFVAIASHASPAICYSTWKSSVSQARRKFGRRTKKETQSDSNLRPNF